MATLGIIASLALTCWGALALYVHAPGGRGATRPLIGLWLACATGFIATRFCAPHGPQAPLRAVGTLAHASAALMLLGWWCTLRPSNQRDWIPEVAQLLRSQQDGRVVTLHNVRCFDWHDRDVFEEKWLTRAYDIDTILSVDLLLSSWGRPSIAHVMVSFGFADGRYLAFSVEIRRKRGDRFSELGGFFRQYERCIVAADENDIVKVRTNVRGEEGELFRIQMPAAERASLFEAYLAEANRLVRRPRFYNTITANCTTLVFQMARRIVPGLPLDYRLLATGRLPEYLARIGALQGAGDVASYRRLGRFTERARASAGDFSTDIRRGVPGVRPPGAPARGAQRAAPR